MGGKKAMSKGERQRRKSKMGGPKGGNEKRGGKRKTKPHMGGKDDAKHKTL